MSVGTACGKVILLGEHAVVYGRPALAVGIDEGARAEAVRRQGASEWSLHVEPWGRDASTSGDDDLSRALRALVEAVPSATVDGGAVRVELHVPPGGGLGSSAALGVAVARAVGLERLGRELSRDETLAAALPWERVFHGNPSGVDHTVATCGGAGVFSKGEGFVPVGMQRPLRLLIADSGERSSTKDMVAQVARIHARKPEATEQTFDAIASLVRNGALALAADDLRGLGQLMDLNQALLASLLLSSERIEAICAAARSAGALGAKLTGGGGGGCVIALAGEHEEAVRAAWKGLGITAFAAEVRPVPA